MRRLASTWNCRQGALSGATCSFYLGGATQAAWQCHTKHRAALEGPQSPINRSHPLKPQFCLRCIFEWLVACVEQFICSHVKTRQACEIPTVKGIQLCRAHYFPVPIHPQPSANQPKSSLLNSILTSTVPDMQRRCQNGAINSRVLQLRLVHFPS